MKPKRQRINPRPDPRCVAFASLGIIIAIEAAVVVCLYAGVCKDSNGQQFAAEQGQDTSPVLVDSATRATATLQPHSWLHSERVGNDGTGLGKADIQNAIVQGARGRFTEIISQTVCAPESEVYTSISSDVISSHSIREGIILDKTTVSQLIYRAIYENQYGPARVEAKIRLRSFDVWQKQAEGSVGIFDFYCPDAKFLIFEGFTAPTGLGSHLRSRMAMPVLFTGLAHRRVVQYVPAADVDENPMTIVGCDRHDLQCSFQPMSPCILTREEIDNAPIASNDWDDYLRRNPNQRVVKISRAVEKHFAAAVKLSDGKMKIVENYWNPEQRKQRLDMLVRGMSRTIADIYFAEDEDATSNQRDDDRSRFQTALRKSFDDDDNLLSKVEAAAQLFITRPNVLTRGEISRAVKQVFSLSYDFRTTIGMPIRGSDKCHREQECVDFNELMKQMYEEFPMNETKHVLVTSEDAKVLDSAVIWKMQNKDTEFELIMNKDDVGQATGQFIPGANPDINLTEVMTSTMIAWACQLRTGHPFLNICSNFHRLIEASIQFGCSAATMWKRQNVTCNVIV